MADPTTTSPELIPSESTPLLSSAVNGDTAIEPVSPPSSRERTLAVVIGTWVQLVTGILCFALAIAAGIIRSSAPARFNFYYAVTELISPMLYLSVIGMFFAGYNLVILRRTNTTLPSLVNIVVNFILLTPLAMLGDWEYVDFGCREWQDRPGYPDPYPPNLEECWRFARMVTPVLWAFGICSLLFCLTSAFLLITGIMRLTQWNAAAAVSRGSWWQMPTRSLPWQMTVEFTIKFVHPDSGPTRPAGETVAAAEGATRQTAGQNMDAEA